MNVHPSGSMGEMEKFLWRHADGAVIIARRWIDGFVGMKRSVKVDGNAIFYGERADAAWRMADQRFHVISRNHPPLLPKRRLELVIVHPRIPCEHNEQRLPIHQEGKRLCDVPR